MLRCRFTPVFESILPNWFRNIILPLLHGLLIFFGLLLAWWAISMSIFVLGMGFMAYAEMPAWYGPLLQFCVLALWLVSAVCWLIALCKLRRRWFIFAALAFAGGWACMLLIGSLAPELFPEQFSRTAPPSGRARFARPVSPAPPPIRASGCSA